MCVCAEQHKKLIILNISAFSTNSQENFSYLYVHTGIMNKYTTYMDCIVPIHKFSSLHILKFHFEQVPTHSHKHNSSWPSTWRLQSQSHEKDTFIWDTYRLEYVYIAFIAYVIYRCMSMSSLCTMVWCGVVWYGRPFASVFNMCCMLYEYVHHHHR